MIARGDGGQVVLVSGAIPGERVQARIERVSRAVAFAETIAVEEPSPDRLDAVADPLCGGCLFGHIAYPRQLEIKSAVIGDAFARVGRMTLPCAVQVAPSPQDGYRMRARLHVRGRRFGFFREGTHDLCDARQTHQLLPATTDALDRLVAGMQSLGIDVVREIELAENVDASDRAVALDAARPLEPRSVERLAGTEGVTGLTSAWGTHGSAYVIDRIMPCDGVTVELRRHVLAFFQGNRHLLNDFVAHVVGQVAGDVDVVDLYAGVGLFSVSVAVARGVPVTAVEGDRLAASDLEVNAARSGASLTAVHQPVEAFVVHAPRRSGRPLTVIVDPPRTGMSRDALDGLMRLQAARLVYVSCDVATLARDARRLVDGGYAIEHADAFDLFPNTPHVETVVVLARA
jgi:23S rRNA (uracil1939-C5)-methyltransferase